MINARVSRIKRVLGWASSKGLVPASTYHGLIAVAGLKRDRSAARDTTPVACVPESDVQAALLKVNPFVRAMIQVQEPAGMRPQDIRNLRTCDLDQTGDVWIYTPWTHKTEHHGHVRQIAIGPRAQAILRPFLRPNKPAAYLFSPRMAVDFLLPERKLRRKTKRTPCEGKRRRKERPERKPGEPYTKTAYEQALARACVKACVSHWHPNQLRHNCATRVRRLYGLEGAAAVLGHRLGTVTEVYAAAELQKALLIMR
jgi:integrase